MTDIQTLIKNKDWEALARLIADGFLQLDKDLKRKEKLRSKSE